jgi:hypothetical protein
VWRPEDFKNQLESAPEILDELEPLL